MRMVTVSVPGKVHLMGEHAVVYGKPALLSAINKRLTVSVTHGKQLHEGYVAQILAIIRNHFHLEKLDQVQITIDSDIPAGYHLGSSAAVAAGVIGAVSYFVRKVWNPTLINQLAYEAEKIVHGNPSGGDNTAVTMGGFLWFRKELEFLKSMWQLPFTLPEKLNNFYLMDTGKPKETTKEMVTFVRSKVKSQKSKMETLMNLNEIQTKLVAAALKEGDEKKLIRAIQIGERTLEHMGVVSQKAVRIIRQIEKAGGAAKILGGGGKADGVGYLLCYTHRPPKDSIPISLGEEGIRLESQS